MKKILFIGLIAIFIFQGCVSISFQCCVYNSGTGAEVSQTNRGG